MGFGRHPNMGHKSRAGKVDAYPYDLDASERVCRPKTGYDIFPQPNNWDSFAQLGNMTPLLRQFDGVVLGMGYGGDTYGPIVSALPVNLQWQITVPGLNKQMPSS